MAIHIYTTHTYIYYVHELYILCTNLLRKFEIESQKKYNCENISKTDARNLGISGISWNLSLWNMHMNIEIHTTRTPTQHAHSHTHTHTPHTLTHMHAMMMMLMMMMNGVDDDDDDDHA